jgi:DNA-binding response OmpR family regulator
VAADEGARPLVLAADDDHDILALVAFRLGRAGYSVITAEDGEQALELARDREPDLIILDVRMPKLTGLDVVRLLRAREETSTVPVILLTASVQDESVERGFEAGADDYIKKPFSPEQLVSRVGAILARI